MTESLQALPSALELDLPTVLAGRRVAVFLDYDGTLTPIVPRPEDAAMSPPMTAALQALAERCPVAVLSGRDLADVRARVGVASAAYAGSHGFDYATPSGFTWQHPEAQRFVPLLDRVEAALNERLRDIPGAQIERKRFSLSAHFRRVPTADLPAFEQTVRSVIAANPGLHHGLGKMVHDFRPALSWNKGKVLHALRERMDVPKDARTIFLGDDRTDEDAFAALAEGDLGIFVGSLTYATLARYGLRDTEETRVFLERLTDALPRKP